MILKRTIKNRMRISRNKYRLRLHPSTLRKMLKKERSSARMNTLRTITSQLIMDRMAMTIHLRFSTSLRLFNWLKITILLTKFKKKVQNSVRAKLTIKRSKKRKTWATHSPDLTQVVDQIHTTLITVLEQSIISKAPSKKKAKMKQQTSKFSTRISTSDL